MINLFNGSLNSPLPSLDIVKLFHEALLYKVNNPVLSNSDMNTKNEVLKSLCWILTSPPSV